MKTFGVCSNCNQEHYWREIDFDNMLYLSSDNAICVTLCPNCKNKFLETRQNQLGYKNKINNILKGKSKPVLDFNLGQQVQTQLFWGLSL